MVRFDVGKGFTAYYTVRVYRVQKYIKEAEEELTLVVAPRVYPNSNSGVVC